MKDIPHIRTAALLSVLSGFALTLCLGPSGCGSARRSVPVAGPMNLTETEQRGQTVFMAHCYQCHPGGRAGLGPALNNKPLPAFAIRAQVRQGFGEMPAFSEEDISDADLDALANYVIALRGNE